MKQEEMLFNVYTWYGNWEGVVRIAHKIPLSEARKVANEYLKSGKSNQVLIVQSEDDLPYGIFDYEKGKR